MGDIAADTGNAFFAREINQAALASGKRENIFCVFDIVAGSREYHHLVGDHIEGDAVFPFIGGEFVFDMWH